MKRLPQNILLTMAALLTASVVADAQQFAQIRYQFGMNVVLTGNGNAKGLQVNSVTPNGAAARAGLRPGDVIVASNGRNFNGAHSDVHGVNILQSTIYGSDGGGGGGGVPTAVTTNYSQPNFGGGFYSRSMANLTVYRYGQQMNLTVYPVQVGGQPTSPPPFIGPPVVGPPVPPPCVFPPPGNIGVPTNPGTGVPTAY